MKKTVALLLMTILMISLIVPAFAKPVAKCPECNGEYYGHTYEDWHWVDDKSNFITTDRGVEIWRYRQLTDIIHCSEGGHNHSQTKDGHYRVYSWIEGLVN